MFLNPIIPDNSSNSFKARKLSQVRVKLPSQEIIYDVYKLSEKDNNFLEGLKSKIDLKELWTSLKEKDYEDWQFILNRALCFSSSKQGYLVTHENKPCGVLNARKNYNNCDVHWVVTWPLEKNKKMPLVGKILFLQLFRDIINQNDVKQVHLTSIKGDAFKAFSKYRELNFFPYGGDGHCELMRQSRITLQNTIDKFKDLVSFTSVDEPEVDLNDICV